MDLKYQSGFGNEFATEAVKKIEKSAKINDMQTDTLEQTDAEIAPINETAELINREIHAKNTRTNQCFGA